ncbi:MAG: amino acid ABC transporter ATP-binding protein [Erysipelotrichaceae bacterium]|nr:amino acid ABC transporter ATP-binding protein [Erysipelotrichaceae bacterium]
MLEVKNLKKSYGNNQVLKGISFKVETGDKIAIVGASGCGKSTLLRCLNLLEKPNSGDIYFHETNITKLKDLSPIREKMGMVFQQFNLFNNLTVLENIILAPVTLKIMDKNLAVKKALKLLNAIGLKRKKDNYPHELSGGEQQRVAIARALIMNPDLLLFDEPTSALDPSMVNDVLDLINEIAESGMTFIIVSHEIAFVRKCCNKLLYIESGKIAFFGSIEEAFAKDNLKTRDFLQKE